MIESRISAEYFWVESLGMKCGMICTKGWNAQAGSEGALYPMNKIRYFDELEKKIKIKFTGISELDLSLQLTMI